MKLISDNKIFIKLTLTDLKPSPKSHNRIALCSIVTMEVVLMASSEVSEGSCQTILKGKCKRAFSTKIKTLRLKRVSFKSGNCFQFRVCTCVSDFS